MFRYALVWRNLPLGRLFRASRGPRRASSAVRRLAGWGRQWARVGRCRGPNVHFGGRVAHRRPDRHWFTGCHHLPVNNRGRRCDPRRRRRANHAGPDRSGFHPAINAGLADIIVGDPHQVARDGAGVNKRLLRNCCNRARAITVHVSDLIDSGTRAINVVHIGDLGDIHHGVGYVHTLRVSSADSISGNKNFSWTQRKPAHSGASAPTTVHEHN